VISARLKHPSPFFSQKYIIYPPNIKTTPFIGDDNQCLQQQTLVIHLNALLGAIKVHILAPGQLDRHELPE